MGKLFQTCVQNIYPSESWFVQLQSMTTKTSIRGLPLPELMPIEGPGHIKSLNLNYEVAVSMKHAFSAGMPAIALEINLKRIRSQVFIENIVPSGFLVVVSWVLNPNQSY